MRWCNFRPDVQNFKGTCAEKAVKKQKLIAAQELKQTVLCEGAALKNVYQFKYLGSIFTADGSEECDVKRRIAIATRRMGTLRNVFDSEIPLNLKLKIYKTAVYMFSADIRMRSMDSQRENPSDDQWRQCTLPEQVHGTRCALRSERPHPHF